MSELGGCKSSPDIGFNHDMFEFVTDLEKESGGWLLLVQRFETSSMLFQNAK
jgi:hypothetical protein